jgi:hypothetical protein
MRSARTGLALTLAVLITSGARSGARHAESTFVDVSVVDKSNVPLPGLTPKDVEVRGGQAG